MAEHWELAKWLLEGAVLVALWLYARGERAGRQQAQSEEQDRIEQIKRESDSEVFDLRMTQLMRDVGDLKIAVREEHDTRRKQVDELQATVGRISERQAVADAKIAAIAAQRAGP